MYIYIYIYIYIYKYKKYGNIWKHMEIYGKMMGTYINKFKIIENYGNI